MFWPTEIITSLSSEKVAVTNAQILASATALCFYLITRWGSYIRADEAQWNMDQRQDSSVFCNGLLDNVAVYFL